MQSYNHVIYITFIFIVSLVLSIRGTKVSSEKQISKRKLV